MDFLNESLSRKLCITPSGANDLVMPRKAGPKILFSLSCFIDSLELLPARASFEEFVARELVSIDGVEIYCDLRNFAAWISTLCSGNKFFPHPFTLLSERSSEILLRLPHNTIHLPDLKALSILEEEALIIHLSTLYDLLGIDEFTLHPDEIVEKRWKRMMKKLPKGITLSIENMDPRKRNYQTLSEIAQLLNDFGQLQFTFDVCHWLECGNSLTEKRLFEFLQRYSNRISKIHFSVPQSRSVIYRKFPHIMHKLSFNSGYHFPEGFIELLPSDIAWVIEGYVPPDAFSHARSEIEFVRRLPQKTVLELNIQAA